MTVLKQDFDASAKPEDGVMHEAIFRNASVDTIRKLLERGGNIEERNATGHTPLIRAMLFKRLDIMQLLIEKKANLNAKAEGTGKTALMLAAICRDSAGMVRLLIESGADIDAKDTKELTALDHAKKYDRQDLVEVLEGVIEARATAAVTAEVRAWHATAEENHRQIKELFLKRKKRSIIQNAGI